MKKNICLIIILCLSVILVSCSNKKNLVNNKREVSSKIDSDLVQQLVGTWEGDGDANYPAYGKYTIEEKDGYLFFDEEKLQIVNTEDNEIFTQTKEENPSYYDFKLNDNKLTVYPSYPVPEGTTGGNLAPMGLVREDDLSIDLSMLVGKWESIDEQEIYYIIIEKVSDSTIKFANNLQNNNNEFLEIEEISKNSILALTSDNKTRYTFIFSEKGEMTSFVGVNADFYKDEKLENTPVGLSKPMIYRKMND